MRLKTTTVRDCRIKGYPIGKGADNYKIEVSGNEVGVVSTSLTNRGLYIEYIEIDKEFQGYGYFREALIRVLNLYSESRLSGMSTADAEPKWRGLGAVLEIEKDEDIETYDEIGECIPFELELDKLVG